MEEIKSLSLRLTSEEYLAFDAICKERGYSKTGKIREYIRNLIKEEIEAVNISAKEWTAIEKGITEIEKGEYVTLEELKRGVRSKKVADSKNSKKHPKKHPIT